VPTARGSSTGPAAPGVRSATTRELKYGPGPDYFEGRFRKDARIARRAATPTVRPEHPWTTETLAAAKSVSRATLSRHLRSALGQTPGAYVKQWRMDLASVRLRDTDEPVEPISGVVGYGSPHAFSRAFRRARGMGRACTVLELRE
jgi:transcriptional regulator GlxA family with amidase domain